MMTVRDLMAILQDYDPLMPILIMRADDDGPYYMPLESVVDIVAKQYPNSDDWNIRPKVDDKEVIKTLLLE